MPTAAGAAAGDKRKSCEDEKPEEGWSSPLGATKTKPSGPDNRKPVLQLDPEAKVEIRRHESQRAAVNFVGGNASQMSSAIKNDTEYMGFRWRHDDASKGPSASDEAGERAAGNDAGGGAGARCGRSKNRAAIRQSAEGGRRLVVAIDFGHAGTGYAMAYKDAPGLCLPGNAKMSLPGG